MRCVSQNPSKMDLPDPFGGSSLPRTDLRGVSDASFQILLAMESGGQRGDLLCIRTLVFLLSSERNAIDKLTFLRHVTAPLFVFFTHESIALPLYY